MAFDPVHAVLSPPELVDFRVLVQLGDERLEVDFEGWSKLALLSGDRAFLFARRGRERGLLHGAGACEVLSSLGVSCVPRVLGRWELEELSCGPCVAFERRFGSAWTSLEHGSSREAWLRMLQGLGRAVASWHALPLDRLPPELLTPVRSERSGTLSAMLGDAPVEALVEEAAFSAVDRGWPSTWRWALEQVRALDRVLLHGDVCENQLLIDEELRVTTVLDWDTAGTGHRLFDFDFGEWGPGIYRWEESFFELRRAMWDAYRTALGAADRLPSAEVVHLVFVLADLVHAERANRLGTLDARGARRLRHLRGAIGDATAAAG